MGGPRAMRGDIASEDDDDATRLRKALVFDDNPDITVLAVGRLKQLGFDARSATEKADFLSAVSSWRPDLILLDLSLGDTDAIELFAILGRENFGGQIILMSGHSGAVLDHARRLGKVAGLWIAGVLEKPFRQRDLRALVANLGISLEPVHGLPLNQASPALLREALAKDWLEFCYQPKIDLATNCVVGAECLARIRHPERGLLQPASFLTTASDDELYGLTTRALDDAFRSSLAFSERGRPLVFSVNVAARTFVRSGLIDDIRSIRDRHAAKLTMILELTETDLVNDKIAAAEFATRAILNGFPIAIDDFGHGYATFDRLRDIPFTELKLERSMVNGCARDPALKSICKAAAQLAHGFGAKAVAEGMERADDLAVIRSLGFDMAQGYLFSRPVPIQELTALPTLLVRPRPFVEGATG